MKTNDNGIDREMTETEIEALESNRKQAAAENQAFAKIEADRVKLKEATLTKLGLTADEVAALLS
jgi:hypothetical protein